MIEGNIKWTSLMLPEQVKALRYFFHEEYYDHFRAGHRRTAAGRNE